MHAPDDYLTSHVRGRIVHGACSTTPMAGEAVALIARECEREGARAIAVPTDVCVREDVAQSAAGSVARGGAAQRRPYTVRRFCPPTYTLPLATVGTANFTALPATSRRPFWSLAYNECDTSGAA